MKIEIYRKEYNIMAAIFLFQLLFNKVIRISEGFSLFSHPTTVYSTRHIYFIFYDYLPSP